MRILSPLLAGPALAVAILAAAPLDAALLPDSIREVPAAGPGPHVVRTALSSGEESAGMTFYVSLRMRDVALLQARVAAGETVSPEEMEARYLPLASDYERVAAWLSSRGFAPALVDRNHTVVGASGSVRRISEVFGVRFARVRVPAAEDAPEADYTSAVTAPALPDEIAAPVLGIQGLQPHIRFRHTPVHPHALPLDVVSFNGGSQFSLATPDNVVAAYGIPKTMTGQGQTIAILEEAAATNSDLAGFWNTVGVSQTVSNVTPITVSAPANSASLATETALDVEWAGALAPAAKLRIYLDGNNVLDGLFSVLNDLPSNPGLSVVSISFGSPETRLSLNSVQTYVQTLLQLANAGVTVCVSSGDGGSNPSTFDGSYGASNTLAAEYPASDPNAAGIGGTILNLDSNFAKTGEVAWNLSSQSLATGGGISKLFAAPSWQTGIPSSLRCVPDVSAIASCTVSGTNHGAFVVQGGALNSVVGTSLACPVWAAICAGLNQARATAGLGSLGLLGPKVYPLAGKSSFTDITSGSNGAYSAAAGYDLCTGLGSPNVAALVAALADVPPVPSVTVDSHVSGDSIALSSGSSSTSVTVRFKATDASANLTGIRYNVWNPPTGGTTPGTGTLDNNGGAYASVSGSSGEVDRTVTLTAGDWYFWTDAQNSNGDSVSTAQWSSGFALHVTGGTGSSGSSGSSGSTAAASSGGGGGGGAPGLGFYGALAALVGARLISRRRAHA